MTTEKSNPHPKMTKTILENINSHWFLRLMLFGFLITTIPLIIFGIPFSLIGIGLLMTVLYLSPILEPARRLTSKIMGVTEEESPLLIKTSSLKPRIWFAIHSLPYMALAGFGIWLLIKYGFLELNIIHMLLSH